MCVEHRIFMADGDGDVVEDSSACCLCPLVDSVLYFVVVVV